MRPEFLRDPYFFFSIEELRRFEEGKAIRLAEEAKRRAEAQQFMQGEEVPRVPVHWFTFLDDPEESEPEQILITQQALAGGKKSPGRTGRPATRNWDLVIVQFLTSGQPLKRFCRERGYDSSQIRYHLRRVGRKGSET